MAVDVPASFIAQTKTPPRYPPTSAGGAVNAVAANPRYSASLTTFSPRGTENNSSTSSRQSRGSGSNGSIGNKFFLSIFRIMLRVTFLLLSAFKNSLL